MQYTNRRIAALGRRDGRTDGPRDRRPEGQGEGGREGRGGRWFKCSEVSCMLLLLPVAVAGWEVRTSQQGQI